MAEVRGTAFIELSLNGRWALSILTDEWSDAEKQALLDDEADAREALEDALTTRVLNTPDEMDRLTFEIHIAPSTEQESPDG